MSDQYLLFLGLRIGSSASSKGQGIARYHRHNYFIVGMENSAPSLVPLGQREVTVFVRV